MEGGRSGFILGDAEWLYPVAPKQVAKQRQQKPEWLFSLLVLHALCVDMWSVVPFESGGAHAICVGNRVPGHLAIGMLGHIWQGLVPDSR